MVTVPASEPGASSTSATRLGRAESRAGIGEGDLFELRPRALFLARGDGHVGGAFRFRFPFVEGEASLPDPERLALADSFVSDPERLWGGDTILERGPNQLKLHRA